MRLLHPEKGKSAGAGGARVLQNIAGAFCCAHGQWTGKIRRGGAAADRYPDRKVNATAAEQAAYHRLNCYGYILQQIQDRQPDAEDQCRPCQCDHAGADDQGSFFVPATTSRRGLHFKPL